MLLGAALLVIATGGAWYAYVHKAPAAYMPPAVATSSQQAATTTDTASSVPPKPGISAPLVHAYGSVTLMLGQPAKFADVTITPLAIAQDSRCPIDVQCIQAGTVQVSVRIASASGTDTQTLSLNKAFATPAGTITLTGVQPVKRSGDSIASPDYRLTFDVTKKAAAGKCYVGGCSSEICSDQPGAISACVYTASFGCYRSATCERQASGACGWTQTPSLKACLANPPQ